MAIEKKFKILIYPGLHTRPGAKFVQLCNKFESDIEISFEDKVANGKSMINIMNTLSFLFVQECTACGVFCCMWLCVPVLSCNFIGVVRGVGCQEYVCMGV